MSNQAELLKQQARARTAARRLDPSPASVRAKTMPAAKPSVTATQAEINGGESIWGALLGTLIGLALAGAGLAIGIGAIGLAGETKSFWYLSRSAGFVAYLLLWGSVVWGLLLSSKIVKGVVRPPALLDAHQFLSGVGLGFGFFHGLILMGDQYLAFPLAAVLVPFASTYEPLLVAAGQIGLWLSALLIATAYGRRWIGQKVWRWIHYTSFLAYWAVVVHAAALGTESSLLWVQLFYIATGAAVIFLTTYRILSARPKQMPATPKRA
ncbi:MAG: hypothetical protein KF753_11235 [Caldilineaceae bacterium]|nr:hypothetical protein [Caldilineaceae bacterium]